MRRRSIIGQKLDRMWRAKSLRAWSCASLIFATLLPSPAWSLSLTYNGSIVQPNGTPLTNAAVAFTLSVKSPAGCTLYRETQTVSVASGAFAVTLNGASSTRLFGTSSDFDALFSNASPIPCDPSAGNVPAGGNYVPSAGDARVLSVSFNAGTLETLPDQAINAVPRAIDASSAANAQAVGGFPTSALLRVASGTTPGAAAAFSAADFSDLQALIAGTSSKYLRSGSGSAVIPSVSGGTAPGGVVAGSVWFNSATGQINYYNGSSVVSVGSAGGAGLATVAGSTLTSAQIWVGNSSNVAAAVSLSGDATLSNAGVLTLASGAVTASKLGATAASSVTKVLSASPGAGYLLGTDPVTGSSFVAVGSGCLAGQTLVWSATGFACATSHTFALGLHSIARQSASAGGGAQLSLTSNNGSSSVSFRAPDSLSPSYVLVLPSSVGSSGQVLSTDGAGTLSWASVSSGSSPWGTNGTNVFYSGGNVGIGISTPSAILEVRATGNGGSGYFTSAGANPAYIAIDNLTGGNQSQISFKDAGVEKFQVGKQTDNTFYVYDSARSRNLMQSNGGGDLSLMSGGGRVGIGTTGPIETLDVNGVVAVQGYVENASAFVNSSAAYTIPDTSTNTVRIQLTADATITLPTYTTSNRLYNLTVKIKQDATGGRNLTWAAGANTIKWDQSASAATPNATANKETIYQFMKFGDETIWYASMVWKEN